MLCMPTCHWTHTFFCSHRFFIFSIRVTNSTHGRGVWACSASEQAPRWNRFGIRHSCYLCCPPSMPTICLASLHTPESLFWVHTAATDDDSLRSHLPSCRSSQPLSLSLRRGMMWGSWLMPSLTLFSNKHFRTYSLFLFILSYHGHSIWLLYFCILFYWLDTIAPETRTVQFLHKCMYACLHSVL